MFRVIADAIEGLLTQFSWRRLLTLIVFLLIVAGAFVAFDQYTAYFRLARLQKATLLLSQLADLEAKPALASDPKLQSIHNAIEYDLAKLMSGQLARPDRFKRPARWLAGGALWFLMSLIFVRDVSKGKNTAAFIGTIVLGGLVATFGLLIPQAAGPYVYFLVYPVGSFLAIVAIVLIAQRKKKRTT